ncbi:hypothetical protein [Aminobacter aminovorans]|uniref:hypothetical protein n=1 Tax=Aminobacter aminovorans TaxID=83263 RepID=UPI002862FEB8|nr:hypothetical protein [Aminobacter aminovorans]MDR7225254.1 hypothetical protein [Aminobacter aminovorans]
MRKSTAFSQAARKLLRAFASPRAGSTSLSLNAIQPDCSIPMPAYHARIDEQQILATPAMVLRVRHGATPMIKVIVEHGRG